MEDTVREIAALARELAVETEHGRLPDALLEKLRSSGLMNAGAPGDAGGLEVPPWAGRGLIDDRAGVGPRSHRPFEPHAEFWARRSRNKLIRTVTYSLSRSQSPVVGSVATKGGLMANTAAALASPTLMSPSWRFRAQRATEPFRSTRAMRIVNRSSPCVSASSSRRCVPIAWTACLPQTCSCSSQALNCGVRGVGDVATNLALPSGPIGALCRWPGRVCGDLLLSQQAIRPVTFCLRHKRSLASSVAQACAHLSASCELLSHEYEVVRSQRSRAGHQILRRTGGPPRVARVSLTSASGCRCRS
jgi:hypothetical protein